MSVYFVTCREAGAVKIGSSLEPHARLSEIQWGCPLALELEAVLPGCQEEEFGFHARFADDRIRGEWFIINEMIEAIIAANPAGPPPDDALKARGAKNTERRRARADRLRAERADDAHRKGVRALEKHPDIHFPFRIDRETATIRRELEG